MYRGRQGFDVRSPTLGGTGAQLVSIGPNLGTREDAASASDLLCAHRYAEMTITDVTDWMVEQVRAIVYLEAFGPAYGHSRSLGRIRAACHDR